MGCNDRSNDENNNGTNNSNNNHNELEYTRIYVEFKENTNDSYADYLSEKYNITRSGSSGGQYVNWCNYLVLEKRIGEVMNNIRNEERVTLVDYGDING